MANMYGADVQQLTNLASAIDQAASQLNTTRQSVGAKVQQSAWVGPVADRFRSDWSSTNNSKVASAAQLLTEAAVTLRKNAAEQTQASAAFGGSPTFISGLGGGAAPISSTVSGSDAITAPALLGEEEKLLNQTIPGFPWTYNQIGSLVPGAATALDVVSISNSMAQGHVPYSQMVDVTAGALRGTKFLPAYVAGVALGMGNTVWQEAQAANFNLPQVATDFSYIQQNPADALQAAGQAIATQLPAEIPDLVKNLIPW